MMKLNSKLIILGISAVASSALFFTGCFASNTGVNKTAEKSLTKDGTATSAYNPVKDAIDGGVTYKRENGKYTAYHINEQPTTGVNFGRAPTPNELKAWDTDIMPDGTGLPIGSGTVGEGEEL
ncbi:MAG: MFS transporter, partial [Sulfurimonas sp.]|nr:MFS transporter [Sulfurimonas sp.]